MIAAALFLLAAPAPERPVVLIDDSQSSYCLATGFCRTPSDPDRPAPGVLFVATGLVAVGIAGLRGKPRP